MRRAFFMVAAAVLAALPPAVAGAWPGGHRPLAAAPAAAVATPFDPAGGSKLTFPLPDAPGPATLAPGAQALVDRAAPGSLLDMIVTLDRPADRRMAASALILKFFGLIEEAESFKLGVIPSEARDL